MATRMQQRRGTAAQWNANTILNAGEIGFESDTNKFKIGDGTNTWENLDYFIDETELGTTLGDYVETSLLGVPLGVATLNASGTLDSSQVPNIDELAQDAVDAALTAGTGITKNYDDNANTLTIAVDTSVIATQSGSETLTNKSISLANNTVSGTTAEFNSALSDGDFATTEGTSTLTNKTINLANNTIIGTVSEFNTALSDASFITTTDTGTVTSTMLADNTIVNADINSAAGIAYSKLSLTNSIVDADINDSAAIAQSKIANLTTDLAGKAELSGAAFTGNVSTTGDLTVDGNFTVNGTNVLVSATQIQIEDTILQLAHQNANASVDLGLVVGYDDSGAKHAGLVKDATDSKWKLFKGVSDEPTTTVNFAQGTLDDLSVGALDATSLTVGNITNTEFGYLDGLTSNVQAQLDAKITSSSTDTLTNKTISGVDNTLTVRVANDISGLGTGVATFLATPSSANFASMLTDEIGTGSVLLSEATVNSQTSSYTLVLADRGKVVEMSVASANNVTVPPNSSVAFPTGTQISVVQIGAGQTTVVAGAGVTVNTATTLKLRAQWSGATLIKRDTDTWLLVGDLATS